MAFKSHAPVIFAQVVVGGTTRGDGTATTGRLVAKRYFNGGRHVMAFAPQTVA